jgi:putative oxidoreductase
MNPALRRNLAQTLDWAARLIVAAYFILAAVPKLFGPLAFAKDITNYRLVLPWIGQDYVYAVAIVMPALELVAAIALLLPRWKRAGSAMCGGLLVLFIVLIAQAMIRGLNIDCGCFGAGAVSKLLAQKAGLPKILENTAQLAGCVYVYLRATIVPPKRRYALSGSARAWK